MSADEIQILKRLEKVLNKIERQVNKPLWVNAEMIFKTTLFTDKEKLRDARERNYLTYRKKGKSLEYDLASVPVEFKINKGEISATA